MTARLNFLCFSEDLKASERCQAIAQDFQYSYHSVAGLQQLAETQGQYDQIQFVLLNASHLSEKEGLLKLVQSARQFLKETFICLVAEKKLSAELAAEVKKAGASMVLLENEYFETSRLEFVASQIIRASYVPVKLSEFPQDAVLDFTLYHLLPLNQKLLPILPKGSPLSETRLKKFEGIGEVFVKREEVDKYRNYVETHPDVTGQGLRSRCRAQYLSFCNSHTQLIFLLLDQGESASHHEAKWLFERCEILARDLLTTLSAVGEAWDVVNNSSLGEFGSVERSPTVAAYAGLISLLATLGEPVDVMIGGLLSDVGMLELKPEITKKLRESQNLDQLHAEELAEYQKHPIFSLHRCLERKLSIKENIKEMILCSHERMDSKGFPHGKEGSKIPMEAMLIQFSERIDRGAMIKMGQARIPIQEVRKQLIETEWKEGKIFSLAFLQKLRPVI